MALLIFQYLGAVCIIGVIVMLTSTVDGQPAEFWNNQAKDALQNALKLQRLNVNRAKNIVFFVGDGMDIVTSTASRIRKGQLAGNSGEDASLEWDEFPHAALSKTYNTDLQVTDSAGAATAFFCGVKTKAGTVGLDDQVKYGNCSSASGAEVDSVLIVAQNSGKATGFITTTRVTHATPSALYAHSPDRTWENDDEIPAEERQKGCKDIAVQLIENGRNINVIMGGGRRNFLPDDILDIEYGDAYGRRTDGRNLIDEWLSLRADKDNSQYLWHLDDFLDVDEKKIDYLLGLFEDSHMQYESARLVKDGAGEPSIWQMTEKAIKILQKNKNGFFLVVEGARIDHGHHKGVAYDAITDTLALDRAVGTAKRLTNEEDTLIIVTGDHGHTMTMSGYSSRGNPIFGLIDDEEGDDGLPINILSYANGPGAEKLSKVFDRTGMRRDLTHVDTEDEDFMQPALVPLYDESHGGQDVAIYARGPMAHLFHGVHEQNYIAHVIKYAACLGEYQEECQVDYQEYVVCRAASSASREAIIVTFTLALLCTYTTLV